MCSILKKLLKIGLFIFGVILLLSIIFPDDNDQLHTRVDNGDAAAGLKTLRSDTDVITGKYIASDPSVIKDGDLYRIFYTCLLPPERTAICQKVSDDGLTWKNVSGVSGEHVVLRGQDGQWDENLETPHILKKPDGEYLLYYGGYTDAFEIFKGDGAAIGLASSNDGMNFTKVGPVLNPTPQGYDNDAAYSPSIIFDDKTSEYFMVYAAHSYCANCPVGVRILSARSSDGYVWKKNGKPLFETDGSPNWMRDGVAEPDIVLSDEGYILFITGLSGDERVIGYATSNQLDGGYVPQSSPIITPKNHDLVLAPSVLLEENVFRIWYLSAKGNSLSVSYQELDF